MVIIGDIHGCIKSLKKLLSIIPKDREIYSVGDLIDRGPDPKSVVSLCRDQGIRPVMGNHEHLLLDYLDGSSLYGPGVFMANGGQSTLLSYGHKISGDHLDFFSTLPLYIETKYFFLSHAGIHPSMTIEKACDVNKRNALNILWNRGRLANFGKPQVIQVIGHSPVTKPLKYRSNDETYGINIDTGCVYPAMGKLTAISFPERQIYQVACED